MSKTGLFSNFRPGIPKLISRRAFRTTGLSLVVASILGLCLVGWRIANWSIATAIQNPVSHPHDAPRPLPLSEASSANTDRLSFVRGKPTPRFRDNLRNDTKYMTSWVSAGWSNDVMTYGHLIYLALRLDRVPIIGMFVPSHIGYDKPSILFSEVFDLPRLSKSIGKPILEWRDVKDEASEDVDELGCWAVWPATNLDFGGPRHSFVPEILKLDISYTDAPRWIKLIPKFRQDWHTTFGALISLAFPETREESLVPARPSPARGVKLPPDEQVLCFDFVFFACDLRPYEYDWDYSQPWHKVEQYMRWTPTLEKLADGIVRRTFGVTEGNPIPPWITIHMRRGDFKVACDDKPLKECFPSIKVIDKRVKEVQEELLERKGINASHVIMTSDESDPTWWKEVAAMGWYAVDHSRTAELFGHWQPVLIDAVIQSNGWGFVGTDESTMSTLARRRVETWRGGVVRTVKWKRLGADDH